MEQLHQAPHCCQAEQAEEYVEAEDDAEDLGDDDPIAAAAALAAVASAAIAHSRHNSSQNKGSDDGAAWPKSEAAGPAELEVDIETLLKMHYEQLLAVLL